MALITRISRLFHADMHAIIDQIETPDLLLKQAIRDMEASLADDEKDLAQCKFELASLNKKKEEANTSMTELQEQLDVCFKSNQDELAKTFIKRQLESEQYLKHLTNSISSHSEKVTGLATQISQHQAQLLSMKQKMDLFEQHDNSFDTDNKSFTVHEEDIELALLRAKQKWSES